MEAPTEERVRIFTSEIVISTEPIPGFIAPKSFPNEDEAEAGELSIVHMNEAFVRLYETKGTIDVPAANLRLSPLSINVRDQLIMEELGYVEPEKHARGTDGHCIIMLGHFYGALLKIQARASKPKRVIAYIRLDIRTVLAICAEWITGESESQPTYEKGSGWDICALDIGAPSVWYQGDEVISYQDRVRK